MEENIRAINANEINEELVLNNKEDLPERKGSSGLSGEQN